MNKLLNWRSFNESTENDLTIAQQNELEEYLYSHCGFDKEDMDESDIARLKAKYDPSSKEFSKFLEDIDSNFDWFSYRMVPKLIEVINEIIEDYYVSPNWNKQEEEYIYDIGDLVDFGKWGRVYVLAFLGDGILVTKNKEDRFLGEEGNGFIIPDNDIDECKLIERSDSIDKTDKTDEDEDDWWKN